ncbi:YraN family protein [Fundidesulfovibrio butyratiphilus]
MSAGHLTFGRQGEDLAVALLERSGYRVVARNWRCPRGEVDIIAAHGATLVFVEVKSRDGRSLGTGAEAVGRTKRARLVRAAAHYLSETDQWSRPCRFDVVSVVRRGRELSAQVLENAFEAEEITRAWQPW